MHIQSQLLSEDTQLHRPMPMQFKKKTIEIRICMLLQKPKQMNIQIQCIIQCYVRNYLHFSLYELYAIFNKVHKVQAINKVQKVRTSQL